MGRRSSPTIKKRRLAAELRRLREAGGHKAADVAKELGCSAGKISQMETCRVGISVPDAKAMLEHFGITGDHREALVQLAREAKQRGWWQRFNDALHPWFQQFVGLETEASTLRSYQNEYIPGLMQTEGYQRALLRAEMKHWADDEISQLVALRKDRQQLLVGEEAPRIWAIVNEASLRRLVGTPEVMLEQLRHLLDLTKHDNIVVQVLPFTAGAHVAMSGAFTILEFEEDLDPDVVYLEHLAAAHYLDEPGDVQRYKVAFEDLIATSLSRTRSASLVREIMKEL
jgi:transcriptional regulator with XRE-family HTH domain